MRAQQPQPGLVELMDYLQGRGLQRALCTRNFEYVFLPVISSFICYVQHALIIPGLLNLVEPPCCI